MSMMSASGGSPRSGAILGLGGRAAAPRRPREAALAPDPRLGPRRSRTDGSGWREAEGADPGRDSNGSSRRRPPSTRFRAATAVVRAGAAPSSGERGVRMRCQRRPFSYASILLVDFATRNSAGAVIRANLARPAKVGIDVQRSRGAVRGVPRGSPRHSTEHPAPLPRTLGRHATPRRCASRRASPRRESRAPAPHRVRSGPLAEQVSIIGPRAREDMRRRETIDRC